MRVKGLTVVVPVKLEFVTVEPKLMVRAPPD
jgi:hypothetical protein